MSLPVRRNPPRSSKSAAVTSSTVDSEWFPDIKGPTSEVHQRVNILNRQAYPSEMFAKADDILIFTAFVQKGKKRRHHSVKPEPGRSESGAGQSPLSNEDGILAAKICEQQFRLNVPSWEAVLLSVKNLQDQIQAFCSNHKDWAACLSQYACFAALTPSSLIFL